MLNADEYHGWRSVFESSSALEPALSLERFAWVVSYSAALRTLTGARTLDEVLAEMLMELRAEGGS